MKTHGLYPRWLACIGPALAGLLAFASAQTNPSFYSGLVWHNIGPLRAGRISAVTGAVGEPGVFYAGLPLGGVWKTTSAGETWFPIFDAVKGASCVGAILYYFLGARPAGIITLEIKDAGGNVAELKDIDGA